MVEPEHIEAMIHLVCSRNALGSIESVAGERDIWVS